MDGPGVYCVLIAMRRLGIKAFAYQRFCTTMIKNIHKIQTHFSISATMDVSDVRTLYPDCNLGASSHTGASQIGEESERIDEDSHPQLPRT